MVLSGMSRPIQIDPQRPQYRAVPILDVVAEVPLDVEEIAPLDVVEALPQEIEEVIPVDAPATTTPQPSEHQTTDSIIGQAARSSLVVRIVRTLYLVVTWLFGLAAL